MIQRSSQFPGYIVREKLDTPRYYERCLATEEHSLGAWRMIRALNKELSGIAELRMCYQGACRKLAEITLDGVIPIKDIGVSAYQGLFAVYPYDWASLTFGEMACNIQESGQTLSPAFFASILLDVVRILDAARLKGLEHCSIIPPFIQVSQFGDVYVSGFVEAAMRRRFHLETELDEKFDAPEWRRCMDVSIECDIYSIGALLYQCITSEFQPDEWEPRWMGMMDVLSRSNLPGEALSFAIEFFQHTLAERPQQRYNSYAKLATALEQFLELCGGYQSRELRVELLRDYFDDYPPVLTTCDDRSDVISLITGDMPIVSPELPKTPAAVRDAMASFVANAGNSKSDRGSSGDMAFEDTLTSPVQVGQETRIMHRSSNSFRRVISGLRSSINVSPVEILARSRYQILDELGSGGTGTVYKVLDTTLGDILALKVLRPELVSDSAWLQRFKRELKIARDLEHAYILPAYHLEQIEGLYFFTMRYIDGKNLSEFLQETPLPLIMSLRILTQIAEALVAAHDRGIIHRDLKPANIMIEASSFHPYLMDFGIASSLDAPGYVVSGQGIGTPFYMAPEQSRGELINVQADVYSFGVVCYECFTQKLPFLGTSAIAIYTAQLSGIFEPILNINPNVPKSIAKLVESCLAPDPADRPASMRIVLDGLGRMG